MAASSVLLNSSTSIWRSTAEMTLIIAIRNVCRGSLGRGSEGIHVSILCTSDDGEQPARLDGNASLYSSVDLPESYTTSSRLASNFSLIHLAGRPQMLPAGAWINHQSETSIRRDTAIHITNSPIFLATRAVLPPPFCTPWDCMRICLTRDSGVMA